MLFLIPDLIVMVCVTADGISAIFLISDYAFNDSCDFTLDFIAFVDFTLCFTGFDDSR